MEYKKHKMSLVCEQSRRLPSGLSHIVLRRDDGLMPPMQPGQFVEVGVPGSGVLLNRPYSVYNRTDEHLELLVAPVGHSSRALTACAEGERLTVIAPLGHGFKGSFAPGSRVLLVGGGVGIAPLYYQLRRLTEEGVAVETVYGSRTAPDSEICRRFEALAPLYICTDDGSAGLKGFVTDSPALTGGSYDFVQICGPKPMMAACVRLLRQRGIDAEVSLENMMACGLGACLCCVEKTVKGNVCVCKEGPVFKFDMLTW